MGLKYKELLERTIETVGCPDAARVELETSGNPLLLVPISQILKRKKYIFIGHKKYILIVIALYSS